MDWKYFMLLWALSLPQLVLSQIDSLVLKDSFLLEGNLQKVDKLQQIYTLDEQGILRKYSPEGKFLFEFQNSRLGELSKIDVTDPFAVMLYSEDFNTVFLLDRTLNPLSELKLSALGFLSTDQVATSRDNQIWLYDQQDFKLKKISRQGNVLVESQDLSLWFPAGIDVEALWVEEDRVYLSDVNQQLLFFNQFGQYIRTFELIEGNLIHLQEPYAFLIADDQLIAYHLINGSEMPFFSLGDNHKKIIFRDRWLFLEDGKVIKSFEWK